MQVVKWHHPSMKPCLPLKIIATFLSIASCLSASATLAADQARTNSTGIPVRGLHLSAFGKKDLGLALEFIRESLPKEGVNTLIIEFNFSFDFRSRPEFANPSALNQDEVQQIVKVCREKQI